jgi:hypothetical protein
MSRMMDPNFKEWEIRIKRVGRNFGNKLRKGEDVLEWNKNRKSFNIEDSSLMNSTNSSTSRIRDMMPLEMTQKVQM